MTEDIFNKKNCFAEWAHVKSELIVGDYNKCPDPIVSIIIPCYNRPDYFKFSLISALNQDCDFSFEIVVVDNNVEDVISQNQIVVEEFYADNVFYYRNAQNIGMAGNHNRGIELARADFITFCHDDDLLLPSCLRRLMELQDMTGNRCVLSACNKIDASGNYTFFKEKLHRKNRLSFFIERPYYNCSLYDFFLSNKECTGVGCLFNRTYMLNLGGFNNHFYPSFDYALICSYAYYYGCTYNAIPTFCYRFAVNTSATVWTDFNRVGYHIRVCMVNKIRLPNFILLKIAGSLYNSYEIAFHKIWEKKMYDCKLSKKDAFVLWIATCYSHRIKPFRIDLSEVTLIKRIKNLFGLK